MGETPARGRRDEAAQAISLWPYYGSAGGQVLIALLIGQRWLWLSIAGVLLLAALVVLAVGLFRVRTVVRLPGSH